jgi:hypothetical protein
MMLRSARLFSQVAARKTTPTSAALLEKIRKDAASSGQEIYDAMTPAMKNKAEISQKELKKVFKQEEDAHKNYSVY